ESRDNGATWELNEPLWNHPTRSSWQPGGGGLCLHSIVPWPGDPQRLLVAVSAAGVWLTDDGGQSWRQGNKGIVARYLPEEAPVGTGAGSRRETPALPGPAIPTACPRRTPTSRSCVRLLTAPVAERISSCTSDRRPARCSGRATPAARGRTSSPSFHRCIP